MREYLTKLLSKLYTVILAGDGIEALEIVNKNVIPQLILSDVMMPRLDG